MLLRIDPTIQIHFQSDLEGRRGLVVESIRRQAVFELFTPEVIRGLELASDWVTRRAYGHGLAELGMDQERAEQFIDDLLSHGLLQASVTGEEHAEDDARTRRWGASGWAAAAALLAAKRHQRYLDYSDIEGRKAEDTLMRAYRTEGAPPEIHKRYPGVATDLLPEPQGLGRTPPECRAAGAAGSARLTSERVSALLRHAFGATGIIDDPIQGPRLRKTHPSGGARHPVECYLACEAVDGLARGIYHYSVAEHGLDRVPGAGRAQGLIDRLTPGRPTSLMVVLTVLPARVMWRYRDPTSFIAMMLDVGHALENFCAVCRCEQLAHAVVTDPPVRELAGELGLAWLTEPPLAAIAIGDGTPVTT